MKNLFANIRQFLKAYYEVFLVNYDIRWRRPSDDINNKRK